MYLCIYIYIYIYVYMCIYIYIYVHMSQQVKLTQLFGAEGVFIIYCVVIYCKVIR